MRQTKGEKIFYAINNVLLMIISIISLYPLLYVLSASLSDPEIVAVGKVWLLPKGFSIKNYIEVLNYDGIWTAYGNTVIYAVFGTAFSLLTTICLAYPLSKKRLRGQTLFTFLAAFTMWFSSGMIPTFLNLQSLNLLDSRIGLIVGFSINSFYMFIMRNYFSSSIPDSLEESAKIDGANDLYILIRIYLPLALPCLATLALYYMVDRWNGYLWASIIFKTESKLPLQVLIKKLILDSTWAASMDGIDTSANFNLETLTYATIVVSVIPMLAVYPWLQKYFVKGLTVGAVKG